MNTDIMTIRDVAGYLKLTEKTAYRLVSEGLLPGFKVGGSWRFRRSEIEIWIKKQEQEVGGLGQPAKKSGRNISRDAIL
jgi:excisionase family DNA binding protein